MCSYFPLQFLPLSCTDHTSPLASRVVVDPRRNTMVNVYLSFVRCVKHRLLIPFEKKMTLRVTICDVNAERRFQ